MLVRTDIPLAQQIVQVGHACLEAGRRFEWPEEPCHLVVLRVATLADLQTAVEWANLAGIQLALFDEPDNGLGLTAACTEPLNAPFRRLFRNYSLWSARVMAAQARSPP